MTIHEFLEKYNMHDSFIETMSYNESSSSLEIVVNFCYWMQDDFVEGERENGLLSLAFDNVTSPNLDSSIDYAGLGILKTHEKDDRLVFALYDDINNDYYELSFKTTKVLVTERN